MIVELNTTNILIKNLSGIQSKELGTYNFAPEEALEILKKSSKQDFGYDAEMWRKFFDGKLEPSYYEPLIRDQNNQMIDNLRLIHEEESMHYIAEAALEYLRKTTKQDFGYDADMWRKYLEENLDLSNYLPKNMKE
jgi:hypothetical protein